MHLFFNRLRRGNSARFLGTFALVDIFTCFFLLFSSRHISKKRYNQYFCLSIVFILSLLRKYIYYTYEKIGSYYRIYYVPSINEYRNFSFYRLDSPVFCFYFNDSFSRLNWKDIMRKLGMKYDVGVFLSRIRKNFRNFNYV